MSAAIHFGDHQVLGHIHQAASQIAGVGGFKGSVGQAFTRAVGRNEVLQHVETFTEIGRDGGFNDRTIRLGHQTAHTRQLANLSCRTTSTRVGHHVNGIERLLIHSLTVTIDGFFSAQLIHHHFGHPIARLTPNVHHFVVTLTGSHQARHVLLFDVFDFALGRFNDFVLFLGHQHVVNANGYTGTGGQTEAVLQQLVCKNHGFFQAALAERGVDQARDFFLLECFVQVREGQAFGQNLTQQCTTHRGVHQIRLLFEFAGGFVFGPLRQPYFDACRDFHMPTLQRAQHFGGVRKHHALAFTVDAFTSRVIQTQHHVLRRHDGRLTIGGEEHVVGCQHQGPGFHLGLHRQRHVDGHLVTVEVGIEGRAHQRVQLNGLAFNQNGLKSLDTQTVQSGRTVEHDRMLFDDLFQNIPHHGGAGFHFFLGSLDGGGNAHGLEARKDKGLEKLQSHQLRQTALVQFEGRTYGDH